MYIMYCTYCAQAQCRFTHSLLLSKDHLLHILHHLVHDGSVLLISETCNATADVYCGKITIIITMIIIIIEVKNLVTLWDIGESVSGGTELRFLNLIVS